MGELTAGVRQRIADADDFRLPSSLEGAYQDNIELWMTYLSQDQPWLGKSENLYNKALAARIQDYLVDMIRQATSETLQYPIPSWLHTLLGSWHQKCAEVITLNYDTLVERAAITILPIKLSNLAPENFIDISAISDADVGPMMTTTLSYHKLHGSVNWLYSGRDDFFGESIYYSGVTQWGAEDSEHESRSRHRSQDKEVLIIPPVTEKTVYFNNEYIKGLWIRAGRILRQADRVFVVGYSLPMTDMGINFFLSQYLPEPQTPWYIVNPDHEVVSRFCALLTEQDIRDEYANDQNPVARLASDYPSEMPGRP